LQCERGGQGSRGQRPGGGARVAQAEPQQQAQASQRMIEKNYLAQAAQGSLGKLRPGALGQQRLGDGGRRQRQGRAQPGQQPADQDEGQGVGGQPLAFAQGAQPGLQQQGGQPGEAAHQ